MPDRNIYDVIATMNQHSFAGAEHVVTKKRTYREQILADMDRMVP